MSSVSIVIPTLNEESSLNNTLRQLALLSPPPQEIIVVDGGSKDETVARALQHGASNSKHTLSSFAPSVRFRVIESHRSGRSVQMNYGAKEATGDILCFLHADTRVPDDLITLIDKTLADITIACGGFISLMTGCQTTRWGTSLHNYLKTYYAPLLFKPHLFFKGLRLLFGDQVMFCRRNDFWDCGGFDEALPIMEDGDLCIKLVQKGRIRLVNRIVQSSDRRVARWGVWKANAIYLYIGLLWGIGIDANYLKQFYRDIR
ncbi:MAG: TIGR04283 family arsenosugar biosynthesis glycosyltransferase [Rivularia sp. (in: cyanobacteria)]